VKTSTFINYVSRALQDITGNQIDARSVPYDPDPSNPAIEVDECLGFVLSDPGVMPAVAAKACHLMFDAAEYASQPDLDEALGDFADLMGGMKVGPFLNWHCVYFPGLTQAQIDYEEKPEKISINTLSSQEFFDLLESAANSNVSIRWYSGRGMNGEDCVAIVGQDDEVKKTIVEAIRQHVEIDAAEYASQPDLDYARMAVWQIDNLGNDSVYYFPQFKRGE